MNDTALKSELKKLEEQLTSTTDSFDIHYLNSRISSIKGALAGVVAKIDMDYSSND